MSSLKVHYNWGHSCTEQTLFLGAHFSGVNHTKTTHSTPGPLKCHLNLSPCLQSSLTGREWRTKPHRKWCEWHFSVLPSPWSESHSVVSNSLRPHWLYSPWNSLGQNTGVGSLSLLQEISPTPGIELGLLHCRWIIYQLSYQGIPQYQL